jgi:prepilin-type processing-associated H-X9-DG protein
MKTLFHSSLTLRERAAFAKIELLVVLLVLAMLTGVVASVTRGAKNQIKLAQCAGNLRQFALSHLLYANDYSDKLPATPAGSGAQWPWDLEWNFGYILNQYGMPQAMMYCPGTAPRFQPANNAELYQFSPGGHHIIGYSLTLPGLASLAATNMNYTVTPQPIQSGTVTIPPPAASQRVLVADANLGNYGGNYSTVTGACKLAFMSPHLNGPIPAGGNLAMLDGHVEWRPFSQMRVRTTATSTPFFLW